MDFIGLTLSFIIGLWIGRHFLQSFDTASMMKYEQAVNEWRKANDHTTR